MEFMMRKTISELNDSGGSSSRVRGGAEKHEIYVAAFGGHLFYNLFLWGREGGGMVPSAPLDPLLNELQADMSLSTPLPVADLRGGARDPSHPGGSNSFNFMLFFWKFWQNRMLAPPPPPQRLASSARGNPGSATVYCTKMLTYMFPFVQVRQVDFAVSVHMLSLFYLHSLRGFDIHHRWIVRMCIHQP